MSSNRFLEKLKEKYNYNDKTVTALGKIIPSLIEYYGDHYETLILEAILNCEIIPCNSYQTIAKVFKELDKRGCYVMLSNHNTKLVNELYKVFNIYVIEAKRNINSNGKKRGKVEEVIITNYKNDRTFNN